MKLEPESDGLKSWVVGLLANLIGATKKSLAEAPSGVPDFVETSIKYGSVRAKIRVDFEEIETK